MYRLLNIMIVSAIALTSYSHAQAVTLKTISPVEINSYLTNPGIGWQMDGSSINLPESVTYPYRPTIAWNILNPSEGVYDWSVLDSKINAAVAAGKQISFRVATMMGEGYGGHMVPGWVVAKGAVILSTGEPDYSNCVYQEQWGNFVNTLIQKYDGNPAIAFIDISGYGNFNEWGWHGQTTWDSAWDTAYRAGKSTPSTMTTVDSQARRRLADMFIGGAFTTHVCKSGTTTKTVSYTYAGAQKTQLLMPNAGIDQSTQYVITRRADVGFRHDCLGRAYAYLKSKEVTNVWRTAPVVYEFCSAGSFDLTTATTDLQNTHGSMIHNNGTKLSLTTLQQMMLKTGYRYVLKQAQFNSQIQGAFPLSMTWRNVGNAPAYPKMGQNFQLQVYLINAAGNIAATFPISADISKWLPADPTTAPDNLINANLTLPQGIAAGMYTLKVSIVDQRTGKPIQLAFEGADAKGMYLLSTVEVISGSTAPTATSTAILATATKTVSPASPTPTAIAATATKTLVPASPTPTAIAITPTKTLIPVSPTATVIAPTTTPVPASPTAAATSPIVYEDKNSAFVYSTDWMSISKKRASQRSYKQTNVVGASAQLGFTGQSFSIIYTAQPGGGNMDVYVDDQFVGTINQMTSNIRFQQQWDFPGQLAAGAHTLKLVFTGPAPSMATLDAVIVR